MPEAVGPPGQGALSSRVTELSCPNPETHVAMNTASRRLALFAFACSVAMLPGLVVASTALTASSTSSTASETSSAASNSLQHSSTASSGGPKVAEGNYKIIDIAVLTERPDVVRLRLQAVNDGSADTEFFLFLPPLTFEKTQLAAGGIVTARLRPYGTEFAHAQTQKAFFLVLSDEWHRDLQTQAVTL